MIAADSMVNDLLAACVAQPESRTPLAILADYLEEQGDSRCTLLREYLDLWVRAEVLPTEGLRGTKPVVDLTPFRGQERKLRHFACLCVRQTPLPGGGRGWDLLKEVRGQQTIVMAELYQAELITVGDLQRTSIPRIAAQGGWMKLAAHYAAWTAKTPELGAKFVKLAADCTRHAVRDEVQAPSERDSAQRAALRWQQQCAKLCAA